MATVEQRDYYDILGVSKDASQDEIRKAYRKLAQKLHPDKTGGDEAAEERLKEINEAYDVLKNPKKRKQYDEEQAARTAFGGYGGFGGGFRDAGASPFERASFDDLFGSMFGDAGTHARANRRPGADLEARVQVTLHDVLNGATRRLRVRRQEACSICAGSGADPGAGMTACGDCGGSGQMARGSSVFRMVQPCARCSGTGQTPERDCHACRGSGHETAERELTVTIPKGVNDGMRLRLQGEGEFGALGAPRGDLYVRVDVQPDPFFKRDGRNLIVEVPVTFSEAALGAEITVPTLEGLAKLNVPAGAQPGTALRMRGMGVPGVNHAGRGDELVKINVEVPRKLTAEQRELIQRLNGENDPETHPLRAAFQNLLKRFRS